MSHMFDGCSDFNQSLNSWLINNNTNTSNMFNNCSIKKNNKPIF
jgi:hypothetical protein